MRALKGFLLVGMVICQGGAANIWASDNGTSGALINSYDVNSAGEALDGYDSVSYFSPDGPQEGDKTISFKWSGASWLFDSEADLKAFEANPGRYAPHCGGECALAASTGKKVAGNPKRWLISDGKLYLYNNWFARFLGEMMSGHFQKADAHWANGDVK